MSGSAPSNSQAVDFEKQQAAEADAKEAARQQRLQQGQTLIDQIFSGSPVMESKSYDWSSFKAPQTMPAAMSTYLAANPSATAPDFSKTGSVPAGYTAVQVPGRASTTGGKTGTAAANSSATPMGQYYGGAYTNPTTSVAAQGAAATSGTSGGTTWGLKDASGKIYRPGDPLTYQADTGKKSGGFDDDFYNNYRQKVLDYYNPDEERQYSEAKRDLTYNLARAGTLQSSTAGDKQGELAYNDALQKANIVANANTQTGNLKNQIQANKESLINQLYATEDPTLTANLAESSAAASRLQDPTLTPAAALFAPALSAVGAVGNYMTSPYSLYGAGTGSGSTSPAVRPASESSGKLSGGGYG